jgi:hypothetical protein
MSWRLTVGSIKGAVNRQPSTVNRQLLKNAQDFFQIRIPESLVGLKELGCKMYLGK